MGGGGGVENLKDSSQPVCIAAVDIFHSTNGTICADLPSRVYVLHFGRNVERTLDSVTV